MLIARSSVDARGLSKRATSVFAVVLGGMGVGFLPAIYRRPLQKQAAYRRAARVEAAEEQRGTKYSSRAAGDGGRGSAELSPSEP